MLRTNRMSGFTLIELMVVIVIIGVLASLAIPRFTEASAKAKAAEAPRVLASYESALLATIPELAKADVDKIKGEELIFDAPKDSKWFTYAYLGGSAGATDGDGLGYQATPAAKIGRLETTMILKSTYVDPDGTSTTKASANDCFDHEVDGDQSGIGKAMVPSFLTSGCIAFQ